MSETGFDRTARKVYGCPDSFVGVAYAVVGIFGPQKQPGDRRRVFLFERSTSSAVSSLCNVDGVTAERSGDRQRMGRGIERRCDVDVAGSRSARACPGEA